MNTEAIRHEAHIVNGGEQQFTCPSCKGRGRFISYTGRDCGPCFKCKGAGNVSKGVMAAAKGKETKLANKAQWAADHAAEITYINKRADKGSNYYAGLQEKLRAYGTLFPEVIQRIREDMARDAEFYAKRDAEQKVEKSGDVGVERIEALFATATANGLKKPMFRTERLTIKRAPATGRNAGALYVTDRDLGGEYVGKIVGGKFEARREAKPDTLKLLCEIASDPLEAAVKYGRSTGTCCACGRELTDADSVAAGIGPICAGNFGL